MLDTFGIFDNQPEKKGDVQNSQIKLIRQL